MLIVSDGQPFLGFLIAGVLDVPEELLLGHQGGLLA